MEGETPTMFSSPRMRKECSGLTDQPLFPGAGEPACRLSTPSLRDHDGAACPSRVSDGNDEAAPLPPCFAAAPLVDQTHRPGKDP